MKFKNSYNLMLLSLVLLLICLPYLSANPIPVFPDPEPSYVSPVSYVSSNQEYSLLIPFVFLLDFAANLFIIYLCFFILHTADELSKQEFEQISRYQIILAAGVISCFGIIFEIILGTWIIGLGIILIAVFLSYYIFCSYFFRITKKTALYFSVIALLINIFTWSLYFYYF